MRLAVTARLELPGPRVEAEGRPGAPLQDPVVGHARRAPGIRARRGLRAVALRLAPEDAGTARPAGLPELLQHALDHVSPVGSGEKRPGGGCDGGQNGVPATEPLLGQLGLGDVLDLRDRDGRIGLNHRDADQPPHGVTVTMDVPLLPLERAGLRRPEPADLRLVRIAIVGVGHGHVPELEELLRAVAEHSPHRFVDAEPASVGAGEGHADGCEVERAPEDVLGRERRLAGRRIAAFHAHLQLVER